VCGLAKRVTPSVDRQLIQEIVAKNKQAVAARKAYADAVPAMDTLKQKPNDPEANLAVGKYRCFSKGNWETGLPMLAKGSDERLKALAAMDIAGAASASGQADLGDAWWNNGTRQRAAYWYAKALPGLDGVKKEWVEKRLEPMPNATTSAEAAAVRAGLDWLASQQTKEGSWTLQTQPNPGDYQNAVAATSLSLIPYFRAGHTHKAGPYQRVVLNGLRFLATQTRNGGDMRAGGNMYVQALAAVALCEAYARTKDKRIRLPAQLAIDFIVKAQNSKSGGWRYKPGESGDTSVVGWQVTALTAAVDAKLNVPRLTFIGVGAWLDSVQSENGSAYKYQAGRETTPTMTAVALLCRMDLGWRNRMPAIQQGVARLLASRPTGTECNVYYWYYATRLIHQYGGNEWRQWRRAVQEVVVPQQNKEGATAGSWYSDKDPWARPLGRLGITAFSLMTLEESQPE
jgi:hypothetical protein